MKALQVIDKSFVGGGQTNVRNLIEGLRGIGVDVELACRDGGPLVEWVRALGVTVHPVPFDKRFRPGPAREVARIVRERGIELVHGHGLVATFYVMLAKRLGLPKVPIVYQQHGFHHHNYGRASIGLRKAAERWVCRQAERVIASSREDRDALVAGGYATPERILVMHNGIPEPVPTPEESAQVRKALAPVLEKPGPIVGMIARLHIQKGIDTFLRAAVRVAEMVPEARFVIVGTGEIDAEMHALARSLPLGDRLLFTGSLPSRACHEHFDVVVMASRWEGMPIVLLEYMARRRAIVTTRVAGCLEAVGAEEAELVAVDDEDAISAAVVRLLRDPELARRRGEAARRRFESGFTLAGIARDYARLYQEVLA